MSHDIADAVHEQLADISIHGERPLLICDADEVLVQFVSAIEAWLIDQGLKLDMKTLAITGNVTRIATGEVLSGEEVGQALNDFFATGMEHQVAVPGAADALGRLSNSHEIVILSNVPPHLRAERQRGLKREGFEYPVIANHGQKGPAARVLAAQTGGAVFFIDDLPPNHTSVAEHVPHARLIHYVADPRLHKMMPTAKEAHIRAQDWAEIESYIQAMTEA